MAKETKENDKTICFPLINTFFEDNNLRLLKSSITTISYHLMTLKNHLVKHFPKLPVIQLN